MKELNSNEILDIEYNKIVIKIKNNTHRIVKVDTLNNDVLLTIKSKESSLAIQKKIDTTKYDERIPLVITIAEDSYLLKTETDKPYDLLLISPVFSDEDEISVKCYNLKSYKHNVFRLDSKIKMLRNVKIQRN